MAIGAVSLEGPRVPPAANSTARQLVVILHGYGANGEDLIGLVPYLQRFLPEAAFAAPNAPEPVPGAPFGFQWFSLAGYDPEMHRRNPAEAANFYRQMGLAAVRPAGMIDRFLDRELERWQVPPERLALLGFSQGTMMALHVGLRRATAPAGILGYSGALLGGEQSRAEVCAKPPVLLVHGDADPVVPIAAMFGAVEGLNLAEVPVQWHVCPGLGHSIDPSGIEIGGRFLADVLA